MTAPIVTFDCTADGYDRTKRDDGSDRPGNWQIIFRILREGTILDYCRETLPGTISRTDIVAWASNQCHVNRLYGAIIERW